MLENPLRAALAETAARRQSAGLAPGPVWSALRRLTVAELLRPGAAGRTDLDGVLSAVCEAARAAARRRPGWFYAAWDEAPCLAVRANLLTAAICAALRGVLALPGARGVLRAETRPGGVLLWFQGGAPAPETQALWARLAQEGGGTAVFGAGAVFTAAVRLPGLPGCAPAAAPATALLLDRYSVLYQFLGPWAAAPDG
ncbi:MAG TPA: hypothetical protein H9945_03080 [Candidatus Gemmiger avicola]|uniref:Uncharacterized protein n=1 Tax=Candidatus Gemmiger avicola TaxID=2838605 RepID=A0A9D2M5X2_9FIRM|nr:hypothetical protein [Candidatus Gemmiger avicola]